MKLGLGLGILVSAATAKQMQINYYKDHSCSSFLGNVDVNWADEFASGGQNCYNFHYGTSVNIAECSYDKSCTCFWYYHDNCAGDYSSLHAGGRGAENCIKNAADYKSFRCYYYNKPPNKGS